MGKDKLKRSLFFCLYAILISSNLFGQSGNIEFDHYSTSNGLSNGFINSILHDSKGFIWIGTANGLNRFDGITYKTYYFDLNDSTTIPGSRVSSLVEDSIGNIWVMTSDGLCVYDRKKDNLSRKTIRVNGEKLNNSFINTCFIYSKGKPVKQAVFFKQAIMHLKQKNGVASEVVEIKKNKLELDFAKKFPLNILIAEDNPVNQKLAQRVLTKLGYSPEAAMNGNEVLLALEKKFYDLILMDVQMPELDRLEILKERTLRSYFFGSFI